MRLILLLCMMLLLAGGAVVTETQADPVINETETPKFLYTMSAKSGTYSEGRLTLKDVPLVIYFSDRPARISGQLSIQVFEQGWGQGPDSFKADPPNGTLSILDEAGNKNIVVELSEPNVKVEEGQISFKVRVLNGELPASFGHCSLFIDLTFGF